MFGVAPDMSEGLACDIATIEIQKTTGLDDAPVGNETKTSAGKTPSGYGIQAMGFKRDCPPILMGALSQDPIVMRCAGGF